MARQPRIEYLGAIYHVMARGDRKEWSVKLVSQQIVTDLMGVLHIVMGAVNRRLWGRSVTMADVNQIFSEIDKLIDGWCERRSLRPLRLILRNYPISSGLKDESGNLLDSLKDIKGLCESDLTDAEKKTVSQLVNAVHEIVYR